MKKAICLILAALFLTNHILYAHPPTNVQLNFDPPTKILKVSASHPVTDRRAHYIKEVKVIINRDLALHHILKMQETDASQFLQYSLPDVESGDTIRVEVYCSSFGRKIKELKIE